MPCASSHTTAYQPAGKLDRGLDEAPKRGWTLVSMKKDWKQVFSFEKKGMERGSEECRALGVG
jgi:hypothetical protein